MKKTWFLPLGLALSMALVGCSGEGILFSKDFTGTGEIVTNTIALTGEEMIKGFEIELGNIHLKDTAATKVVTLNIYDYGTPKIEISTNQNIYDTLTVKTTADSAIISGDDNKNYITDSFTITFYGVSADEVKIAGGAIINNSMYGLDTTSDLEIAGSVSGTLNLENVKNFSADVSGAAVLTLANVSLDTLKLEVKGVAEFIATGTLLTYTDEIKGVLNVNFLNLITKEVYIDSSGVASYKLNVTDTLDIKSSGTITVKYKGSPVLSSIIAGANDVSKIEE